MYVGISISINVRYYLWASKNVPLCFVLTRSSHPTVLFCGR